MQNQPRIQQKAHTSPCASNTCFFTSGRRTRFRSHRQPYETTLKNGLRVIVKEDRRAPTAVQMVWYRIGSMDEVDGASGVAHVLEHMMFKGTPTRRPRRIQQAVAAAGGKDNAFTSRDYTAYFQQIPKENWPT